ncbi:transposase (plasmid) [Pseudomonas koreensis]|nr:transposase [Pseudomonas koreensis]
MKPQERFALIMSRQSRFEWGGEYVPSTLAVPREAPKGSRISRLHSQKLGRTLHLLSWPEKVFAQLALYHPDLFEMHEQKMLWPIHAGHPLRGHPLTKGTFPPPPRGTVEIASEIGFKHYDIVVEDESGRLRVPYPYQGDLLLYLLNSRGQPYAVNWTVKDRAAAFRERRSTSPKTPVQQREDREHAELRGELERRYYASAGIRTVEVSRDMVTPTIQANLDLLFGMHDLDSTLETALLDDFSGAVADAVKVGTPVAYVAIEYGARWGLRDQFIAKIYQDIWDRKLLVDFSEPILIDRPLVTGGCDLLHEFKSFFEETAP